MPYSADPATNLADRVRLYVGDTSTTAPELADPEIAFLLETENNNPLRAAARAAEILAAKYAKEASEKRVGPLTLRDGASGSDKASKMTRLARQLWSRATKTSGLPFAGGISQSDKEARVSDGDRVAPAFERGMMAYPVSDTDSVPSEERY